MIEIVIIFITIILGLIAAFILPSKNAVEKGEISKYEGSRSSAVYGMSIFIIIMAFTYFLFVYNNSNAIGLIPLVNGIFFLIVGLGLMTANRSVITLFKMRSMDTMMSSTPFAAQEPESPEVMPAASTPATLPTQQQQASPGASGDIQVSVRLPISGQGAPRQTPAQQSSKKPVKLACPKCRNIIFIDPNQRTGMIQCNHCGFTGKIG